jgi:signal peptidase I
MINNFKKFNSYYLLVFFYIFYIFIIVIFSNNFGILTSYTNISYSMEPVIPLGAVVVLKKEPNYQIGDIISYYSKFNNEIIIVTHRIFNIAGNVYITKGDANYFPDKELVRPRLIIGRVFLVINKLGYLLEFSRTALGVYFTIILPAFLIIITEIIRIFKQFKI